LGRGARRLREVSGSVIFRRQRAGWAPRMGRDAGGRLGPRADPEAGFLDSCQYLGYIYGERRWRGQIGLIYTWDGLHGELEIVDPRAVILAPPMR